MFKNTAQFTAQATKGILKDTKKDFFVITFHLLTQYYEL